MKLIRRLVVILLLPVLYVSGAGGIQLAPVVSKPLSESIELPGELQAFQIVSLSAKIRSYVREVLVDRGSIVRQGQILLELSAPEMDAQIAEAQSKVQAAAADRLQAEAQLTAVQSTYDRMRKAAETPGAIAGNDLVLAGKQVDSGRALVQSRREAETAAQSLLRSQKELEDYLHIRAPFSGVISERLVHPGALVGSGTDMPLLVLQEVARLRLVVPVPEEDTGAIRKGGRVTFHVTSAPGRSYRGTISRIAHALDAKTRTMAVELDVLNRDGSLAPGMYPSVTWTLHSRGASLFVPKTAVVTTSERTFVIRDEGGRAEWVNVVKGVAQGDSVEVSGNLHAGDKVVARATDEMREGTTID